MISRARPILTLNISVTISFKFLWWIVKELPEACNFIKTGSGSYLLQIHVTTLELES